MENEIWCTVIVLEPGLEIRDSGMNQENLFKEADTQ